MLGVVGLLLAGCVAPKEQTTSDDPVRTPRPDVTGGSLETFYSQQVAWEECGVGYECAWVAAPLDWDDPPAGSIEIAIKRAAATGDRKSVV